jgi:hypothetical protein
MQNARECAAGDFGQFGILKLQNARECAAGNFGQFGILKFWVKIAYKKVSVTARTTSFLFSVEKNSGVNK